MSNKVIYGFINNFNLCRACHIGLHPVVAAPLERQNSAPKRHSWTIDLFKGFQNLTSQHAPDPWRSKNILYFMIDSMSSTCQNWILKSRKCSLMSYLITHVIKIIINLPDCYLIFPHLQNYDFFQIWISLGKFKILQKVFPHNFSPIVFSTTTKPDHYII